MQFFRHLLYLDSCFELFTFTVSHSFPVAVSYIFQKSADEFYSYFNNRPFNSIEPDVCHLVYVAKVEITKESEVSPSNMLVP